MKGDRSSPAASRAEKQQTFPYGTVTFLFTDIEGSTPLWERMPDEMRVAVAQHRAILRQAIEANAGHEFQIFGDSFQAAFCLATDGLCAALAAQRALRDAQWGATGQLKVRMGLHTGPAVIDPSGDAPYAVSHTLNRSARLMSAGYGGQILLSQETAELVERELPPGVVLKHLGEHRMKGMLRLEHIYQAISADLPQDFPPLPTGVSHPNNLPAQLSSFVGREPEIAEIERLLDPSRCAPNRLVILTGPGGTGKTRLSLQAGYVMLKIFPGGTWFVELASLTNPDFVPQTAMAALGLQAESNRSALAVLSDFFREKTALLILDNCEHLIEACAQMSDSLLRACSNLRILASSREALGITGEMVFHVPPLSVTMAECPTPDEVLQSEAGRLFVERASSVQPGFAVTAENAPAIAQIGRRLDGIPLAVELAAARIKLLAVDQIAARLDDRFRLLTGGSRTVLPRHQTLKALIDWSWDLLTSDEQALLCRLSVFAGGWVLEAAQMLGDDPFGTLDLLFQLINKSLIILDEPTGETSRYRMLETIRQYSLGKLFEAGESQAMRNRHRDLFLELAERAEPELKAHAQITWSNRLELEHDNLRQALEWSLEQGEAEPALRLAAALHYFWWIRGYYNEGQRWLEAALQLAGNTPRLHSSLWRARALLALSWIKKSQGDYVGALATAEDGLRISRELVDRRSTAFALYLKGSLMFDRMNPTINRPIVEESLSICLAIGDKWIMGCCLHHLAEIAIEEKYPEGRVLFEKSVAVYRETGDKLILTYPLVTLAWTILAEGDSQKARLYYEESLVISREIGRNDSTAYTLLQMSVLARWQGDFTLARDLNEESLAIYRDMGNRPGLAWAQCLLAELDHLQGHPELAIIPYQEKLKIFPEISDNWKAGWCLEKLGDVYYRLGDYPRAISTLEESLSVLGQDSETYFPTLILGEVERARGNFERAASFYRQSLAKLKETGFLLFVPPRLEALAKLALARGNPERAAWLFGAAQTARKKMSTPIPPLELPDYDRNLALLHSVLDEESSASAWEAGQAMTLEQAIQLARALADVS